jgi:prepilin-type N-terminal cleavage/methylation domain-containing protein
MTKKQIAFTLIELLVVIAIIGILSGLIVVTMSGVTTKASIAKGQVFSNFLRNALMLNLISEWKFEGPTAVEGAATINDAVDSWGANNASAISGTLTVKSGTDCFSGKCVFSNGGGGVTISNPDNFDLNYITISVWFKINSFADSGDRWLISKPGLWGSLREGWLFAMTNSSRRMTLWGQATGGSFDTTFSTVYSQGTWYNFVYTYDGDYEKAYVNGALIDSINTVNGTIVPCAEAHESLVLSNGSTSLGFNGTIDEVRIYNAAIPTSQIKEQYYSGLNSLFAGNGITEEEYLSRIDNIEKNDI